ncbi:hypothetical protein RJG79_00005 [Mycoplasmatota bacterium WC44]
MKNLNIFTLVFLIVIVLILSIPFLWKNYGQDVINDLYYKDYTLTEEIEIVNESNSFMTLEFNSSNNGKMYIHLVYNDYKKVIREFNVTPGDNVILVDKTDKELRNVYIYFEELNEQYKWILFET